MAPRPLERRRRTVVVLHGLGRTNGSMRRMEKALKARGHTVHNLNYPSRSMGFEALVRFVAQRVRALTAPNTRPDFVTHSLGGIIVRALARPPHRLACGRVVMLAPPNQGSQLVDQLGHWPLFEWINGPVGQLLGTNAASLPRRLGPVNFELLVIAGNTSLNPLYSWLIPGADDGKVSVESAQVEGMREFITIPASHTFIMNHPQAIKATIQFLENGTLGKPK